MHDISPRLHTMTGAVDLIRECREMLAGRRAKLTPREVYVQRRLAYWQARAEEPTADAEAAEENAA